MESAIVAFNAPKQDKAGAIVCSGKNATNQKSCARLASLNLTSDQKSKIQAWQSECMKVGCTKESRRAFHKKAEGILSKDQYAKLKAECNKSVKKTEA